MVKRTWTGGLCIRRVVWAMSLSMACAAFFVTFVCFESSAEAAPKGKIVLEVSENSIAVGDWIQATVRFQDLDPGEFPGLKVPPELAIAGQSQSSSYRLINGESSSEKAFVYDVVGQKPGSVRIGPVVVTIGGQRYSSEQVTITVGPARASGSNGSSAGVPNNDATIGNGDELPFRLDANLSSQRVFVGESVYLQLQLSNREGPVQIQYRELRVPELVGVTVEDIGKPQTQAVVENGIRLAKVIVIKKLTPLKPGELKIDNVTAVADVLTPTADRDRGGFFGSMMPQYARSTRSLSAAPLTLEVAPLPDKDRPSDFSGLIGETEWSVSYQGDAVAGSSVRVGDSLALTVRVSSTGDLGGIKIQPPKADSLLKVYEDTPKIESESRSGKVFQVKEFRYAVVPTREGTSQLGGIKLSFFSPALGKYATLERSFAQLVIAGHSQGSDSRTPGGVTQSSDGSPGGGDGSDSGQVRLLGNDLMPLKSQLEYFDQGGIGSDFLVKVTSIPLFSCLGFVIVFLGSRYREQLPLLSRMRRRRSALAVALAALNKLMQRSGASGAASSAKLSVLSRYDQVALAKTVLGIVRDYLAARTGVSTAQKTSAEMRAAFGGDSQASWQALTEVEGLIYSNDVIEDQRLGALVDAVKADLERLDKRL